MAKCMEYGLTMKHFSKDIPHFWANWPNKFWGIFSAKLSALFWHPQKSLLFRPNLNVSQVWYWPKKIWKIAIIHPLSVAKCMQSTSWKGSFTAGNSAVEDQLTQASRTRPTRATGRGRRNQGGRRGRYPPPDFDGFLNRVGIQIISSIKLLAPPIQIFRPVYGRAGPCPTM